MNNASKRTRGTKAGAARSLTAGRIAEHPDIAHMAEAEASSRAALRKSMIAEAAYFRAERRGFEPGHDLEDWLEAEVEVGNALQLTAMSPGEETALRRLS